MDEKVLKNMQEAKSVEEILAYAKGNGISLTEEQAKEIFSRISGVLSDEDLENAAGGSAPIMERARPAGGFLKQPH